MEEIVLECKTRIDLKKSKAKEFRANGEIPAVVYGHGGNKYIVVNRKQFDKAMHTQAGHNVIINLKLDDSSDKVIVKEIQRFPIDDSILHVDFQRISLTEKIEVLVPVHVLGASKGVKEKGGVLEHIIREIKVRCLPTNIPGNFEINVTDLDIGEGVSVGDITLPEGVELMADKQAIVVNVVASTKEEEKPAAEAAATSAEPEVITKGKKEEEGAQPAAGGAKVEKAPPAK